MWHSDLGDQMPVLLVLRIVTQDCRFVIEKTTGSPCKVVLGQHNAFDSPV
jgi:hypothetical protein